YFDRGVVFSRQGKSKDAIQDFEEAIRLKLAGNQAHIGLAYELAVQKNYERAIAVLDHGINVHGADADLLFRRGCALYSASDFEIAILDFDSALGLRADFPDAFVW